MNIKPLALVVPMLIAGTATAGELYSNDTNKVEAAGWVKAFGDYSRGDFEGHKDVAVKTDAELKFTATHEIDEVSKVLGHFKLEVADSTDSTAKVGGIKFEYDHSTFGNLSLGATGNSFGAAQKGHTGEGNNLYKVSQGGDNGQGVRYKKSIDKLDFSANVETDSDFATEDKANYAASLSYKGDDFYLGAAFGSNGGSSTTTGLGATLTLGDAEIGASYINFKDVKELEYSLGNKVELPKPNSGHTFAAYAKYTIDSVVLYTSAQAAVGDFEEGNTKIDVNAKTAYAGLEYKFSEAIKAYAVAQYYTWEDQQGDKKTANSVKFGAKYSF